MAGFLIKCMYLSVKINPLSSITGTSLKGLIWANCSDRCSPKQREERNVLFIDILMVLDKVTHKI